MRLASAEVSAGSIRLLIESGDRKTGQAETRAHASSCGSTAVKEDIFGKRTSRM